MRIVSLFSIGFSFLLLLVCSSVKAQDTGIKFFEGTWSEALKKSAEEKKPVFLDISTSWCGWCKVMKKNTFSKKEVGEYFNSHFINVELDGEKDDGLRLVRKFGVTGYPTVFIIDQNENAVLTSEGYHEPDDLLEIVQSAIKETNNK